VLWRGLGGEPGQEGDLYRWHDRAGREVRLYHLPPDGYEVGAGLPADPERLRSAWAAVGPALRARASTGHVAVFVGADHHAAHPGAAALRAALARLEPSAEVRISRLDEFLRAAWSAVPATVPTLTGELRWSYGYTWTLQGVHGTRAPLKRRHAEAELRLERVAEPLAALDRWHRGADRRPLLDAAWRRLLQAQFHDSIGGCTSDPVARRVLARIEDAAAISAGLERAALHSLAGYDADAAREAPDQVRPELLVWNPVPRARGGVALADLTWFRRDVLVGPPGARTPRQRPSPTEREISETLGGAPFQLLGRRRGQERLDAPRHYPDQDEVEITRVAIAVPEMGGFALERSLAGAVSRPAEVREGVLQNDALAVGIDGRGAIWLRTSSGHRLAPLLALESEPDARDTYTFAPGRGRVERISRWSRPVVLAGGPLVAALETRATLLGGRVAARLVLALHAGSDVVRCTLELDNRATDHRLRLRCAAGPIEGTVAGTAFGVVRRRVGRTPRRYPRETPVTTAPAHRFVVARGPRRSLALFTPGFFEYEARGDSLLLTLLRAVGQLSRGDLSTRPGHAGWPTPTPEAQCLGRERLQFGIGCVAPDPPAAALARQWEDLFLPLRPLWLRQSLPLDPAAIDMRLLGDELIFSALKPAADGDGIVLRCYNPSERPVDGAVVFGARVRQVLRIAADERALEERPLLEGGRKVSLSLAAGEILSLRLAVR
jgi:alpha-mannosidase